MIIRLAVTVVVFVVVWWAVRTLLTEAMRRRQGRALGGGEGRGLGAGLGRRRSTDVTPTRPPPPPHQRVTDTELRQRADELRAALEAGHLTLDEAVGSLMRYGGAGVSAERAGRLLS